MPVQESRSMQPHQGRGQQHRRSPLDEPAFPRQSEAMAAAIRESSHGNPTMAAIFADTAAKTLPNMLANDRGGSQSSGVSSIEQINGTPEQVFGEEMTQKWAALAFMDGSNKK